MSSQHDLRSSFSDVNNNLKYIKCHYYDVVSRSLLDGRSKYFSASDVPGRIQGSVATVSSELWRLRLWRENRRGEESSSSDRSTGPGDEEERDRE